ncbi:for [Symbiodinium sp. CCMP2592]|nr:for [Symbiodinium sp. CCMP2592]
MGRFLARVLQDSGDDVLLKQQVVFPFVKFQHLMPRGRLGNGGFGTVQLVEDGHGRMFALKSISKGHVVEEGMQASVMSEKKVQLMCDCPFIIRLHETFNAPDFLHFLLEVALGGELYSTYKKQNLWGNEDCAKFYVAAAALALQYLHSKKMLCCMFRRGDACALLYPVRG